MNLVGGDQNLTLSCTDGDKDVSLVDNRHGNQALTQTDAAPLSLP